MPQVPRKVTQEVGARALNAPQVRVDTRGAYGEAVGQALERVGGQVEQVRRAAEEQATALEVQEARTKMAEARNRLLYDESTGALNVRGKAAAEAHTKTLEAWEKERKAILGGLKTQRAQQAIDFESKQATTDLDRMLAQHTVQEVDRASDLEIDAQRKQLGTFLANAYNQPEAREKAVKEFEPALLYAARRKGLGAEATQALLADWRGEAAETVLAQYVARQDASGAAEYLHAVKPLLGARSAKWEKDVASLTEDVKADGQVQAIARAAQVPGYPWLDVAKVREQVEKLAPGKLKDEVHKRVNELIRNNDDLRERQASERYKDVLAIYRTTRNARDPRILEHLRWFSDTNNHAGDKLDKWDGLLDQERREREADARARRGEKRADDDVQKRTDALIFEQFKARPVEEQAQANLPEEYGSHVSPRMLAILQQHQNKATDVLGKKGAVDFQELRTTLNNDAEVRGFSKDQRASYVGWVEDAFLNYLHEHQGEKPPREWLHQTRTEALQKSRGWPVTGWFSEYRFQSKGAFEPAEQEPAAAGSTPPPAVPPRVPLTVVLPNGQLQEAAPGDPIPPAERARLIAEFQQVKKTTQVPSEAELRRAWDAEIKRARGIQ